MAGGISRRHPGPGICNLGRGGEEGRDGFGQAGPITEE